MITDLSPWEWLRLAGALLLFVGPGMAMAIAYGGRCRFDRTQTVAVAIGLSIAGWSLVLVWLKWLGVPLTPAWVTVILGLGWLLALWQVRQLGPVATYQGSGPALGGTDRWVLWGAVGLIAVLSVWALRGLVAGPGSDSYHHTLIVQLILEHGGLPDNFEPYAPIASFTYHFGFHGAVAALAWLSGLSPIALTPILGQILKAAAALSVAFFTQALTRSGAAAAASVLISGLSAVFPAFFVNWGRHTQLTGLVLLPLFCGLLWEWAHTAHDGGQIPLLSALAAGIALSHYRVTLMAATGALILLGASGYLMGQGRANWRRVVLRLTYVGSAAVALTGPWVWHLVFGQRSGYAVDVGQPGSSFYALSRLGPSVLDYPTNSVLMALAVAALGWGLWRRDGAVIAIALWAGALLVLSVPYFAGHLMDTISVLTSLYVPASGAIAWLLADLANTLSARWGRAGWLMWGGLAGLSLRGGLAIGQIVDPSAVYVRAADLRAMTWIKEHTPVSARFMVNTFNWDFLPDFVIGSDAGYWLPLLAGRSTVTVPMVYGSERSSDPDLENRLAALHRLGGQLTSPAALALLEQEGVTHVYVGERGGPIDIRALLQAPTFEMLYQMDGVYVFRVALDQSLAP